MQNSLLIVTFYRHTEIIDGLLSAINVHCCPCVVVIVIKFTTGLNYKSEVIDMSHM